MRIEVLDKKSEGKSKCYLAKVELQDYLDALPPDFDSFHIQRDYTNNVYLDRLIETVFQHGHIPTLVLIADKIDLQRNEVYGLKILDGLQRTLRLKAISDSITIALHANLETPRSQMLREHAAALNAHSVDASMFLRVVEEAKKRGLPALAECLKQDQWFEIWVNLSEEQQVTKMLLLNAGHKPVKPRHQLELLFLGVLPQLESSNKNGFVVVREKDKSSIVFSKQRKLGEFHFAAIIASLVAYFLGKPVTTNAELISELQNDDSENSIRRIVEGFSFKFTSLLAEFLVSLDKIIEQKEGARGTQWLGREVVLVGLFAALGDLSRNEDSPPQKSFNSLLDRIKKIDLKLEKFEDARNQQDLGRINLGTINKRAVFNATCDLLSSKKMHDLDWRHYFGEK
jgi:hypothetical protein